MYQMRAEALVEEATRMAETIRAYLTVPLRRRVQRPCGVKATTGRGWGSRTRV
jgi:hypothetical protein